MKTSYFTFGQQHIHKVDGFLYDKDIVVEITAANPRAEMFRIFGDRWAAEYENLQAVEVEKYYSRGVKKIKIGGQDNAGN